MYIYISFTYRNICMLRWIKRTLIFNRNIRFSYSPTVWVFFAFSC